MNIQEIYKRLRLARADKKGNYAFRSRQDAIDFLEQREALFGDPFVARYMDDNGEKKIILAIGNAEENESGVTGQGNYFLIDVNDLEEKLIATASTLSDLIAEIKEDVSGLTADVAALNEKVENLEDAVEDMSGATSGLEQRLAEDELLMGHIETDPDGTRHFSSHRVYATGSSLEEMIIGADKELQNINTKVPVKVGYDAGTNILYVTAGTEVSHIQLMSVSSISRMVYDPVTEKLIIYYYKSGSSEEYSVEIPIGSMIEEWETVNTNTVELIRERVVDGKDKLKANAKISDDNDNILTAKTNGLYVSNSGITENKAAIDATDARLSNVMEGIGGFLADGHLEPTPFTGLIAEEDSYLGAVNKLSEELHATKDDVDNLESDLNGTKDRVESLESGLAAANDRIDTANENISGLTDALDAANGRIDVANTNIEALTGGLATANGRIDTANTNIAMNSELIRQIAGRVEDVSAATEGNRTAIEDERTARENADLALTVRDGQLQDAISNEVSTRESEDADIRGELNRRITEERTERTNEDIALYAGLTAETATRTQEVGALTSRIDALDTDITTTDANGRVILHIIQNDGLIENVILSTNDIASASGLASEQTARENADNAIRGLIGNGFENRSVANTIGSGFNGTSITDVIGTGFTQNNSVRHEIDEIKNNYATKVEVNNDITSATSGLIEDAEYVSSANRIYFYDKNHNIVAEVDTTDFLVSLRNVEVVRDSGIEYLEFTFAVDPDGERTIRVMLSDIVPPYVGGNGININENIISLDERFLDAFLNSKGYATLTGLTENYYTKTQVDNKFAAETARTESTYVRITDLSNNYYTKDQVDNKVSAATSTTYNNATSYTQQALTNYYNKTEVDNAITSATNDMATKTWVNNQGFLTQHQDLSEYAKTTAVTDLIASAVSDCLTGVTDNGSGATKFVKTVEQNGQDIVVTYDEIQIPTQGITGTTAGVAGEVVSGLTTSGNDITYNRVDVTATTSFKNFKNELDETLEDLTTGLSAVTNTVNNIDSLLGNYLTGVTGSTDEVVTVITKDGQNVEYQTSDVTALTSFQEYASGITSIIDEIQGDILELSSSTSSIEGLLETKLDASAFTSYTSATETRISEIEGDIVNNYNEFTAYTESNDVEIGDIWDELEKKLDITAYTQSINNLIERINTAFTEVHNELEEKFDVSGGTIEGDVIVEGDMVVENLTANTISATTYVNLPTASTSQYGVVMLDDELDSGSTNPVMNSAVTKVIIENEETVAAALNDLNRRKADTTNVDALYTLYNGLSGYYLPLSGGTVSGPVQMNGGLTANTISATTMETSNGFFQTSDERFKNFDGDVKVDFEKLDEIPTKYFYWKTMPNASRTIGTSAQALQKIYPELVGGDDEKLSVDYARLSIVALAAIKELNKKIEEMQKEIDELKKK